MNNVPASIAMFIWNALIACPWAFHACLAASNICPSEALILDAPSLDMAMVSWACSPVLVISA